MVEAGSSTYPPGYQGIHPQSGKACRGEVSRKSQSRNAGWLMSDLPKKCCGRCKNWKRLNPDDMTAGEGHCQLTIDPLAYPMGYWPATLQRDHCMTGFVRDKKLEAAR